MWVGVGGCAASVKVEKWASMQAIDYGGGEQFVEVEGRKIAFKVEGQEGGEVLLFVHPWAGSIQIWSAVVPYFSDKYKIVRVDIPRHGKSDKPKKDYDIDLAARAVVGVMDHLKL